MPENNKASVPWYAGKNQDALFYLLIAIFFIELIVGGVAFFYGIIHASPDTPGGPPVARFPWLVWALAAILSPVALILVVHLAGSWLSTALTREEKQKETPADAEHVPEGMRRFYATVRHAPTVVLLLGILLIGAALFFVDGALAMLMKLCHALLPHVPWIAGSLAALLGICFIAHCIMIYRQRKMENEYAWRREVLEKTGLVLTDRNTVQLTQGDSANHILPPGQSAQLPPGQTVLDVTDQSSVPDQNDDKDKDDSEKPLPGPNKA